MADLLSHAASDPVRAFVAGVSLFTFAAGAVLPLAAIGSLIELMRRR